MHTLLSGKLWEELTEEEHQRFPGDYEAKVSQDAIAHDSEEFLATTDIGIVKLRRLLEDQLKAIAAGRDPTGVSFDADEPPVNVAAGNYLID